MKRVGIVSRAYINSDNQRIMQFHEDVRIKLSTYDVSLIGLFPYNNKYYYDIEMGFDEIKDEDKKKINDILDLCDGFIVPGGTYFYKFDEYVINYAIENDKPLFCICLGFQCLCSIYSENRDKYCMCKSFNNDNHYGKKDEYKHSVNIVDNTLLSDILKNNEILVNSVHHHYIDNKLIDLLPCAYSTDGILEGVYLKNKKFVLALQWHPECINDINSKKIFDRFINSL